MLLELEREIKREGEGEGEGEREGERESRCLVNTIKSLLKNSQTYQLSQ